MHTSENGRDAICSISTKSLCRRRNISYFCFIFQSTAANSRSNKKHLGNDSKVVIKRKKKKLKKMKSKRNDTYVENVMKNCCKFNFGYCEKAI